MNISGIYKIQSKFKPIRIYIGSAVRIKKRWNDHLDELRKNKHGNKRLQNHFNKYGESDLQFSVLVGCEKEDLLKTEQYFIDSHNPYFNICKIAGSKLGIKFSEESKLKMKESAKKRPPMSALTKQKHKEISIFNGNKPPIAWGNKNMLGKYHTLETRLKMSLSSKGKPKSEEHKRKMRISHKGMMGMVHSEESKQKMRGKVPWNKGLKLKSA